MEPVQLLGSPSFPKLGCWIGRSTPHKIVSGVAVSSTTDTEVNEVA